MNDYERLIARVKEVNRKLAMLQMTAFGQVIDSTGEEEKAWNEGSVSALQAAKELVEKVVEELPDSNPVMAIRPGCNVRILGDTRIIHKVSRSTIDPSEYFISVYPVAAPVAE